MNAYLIKLCHVPRDLMFEFACVQKWDTLFKIKNAKVQYDTLNGLQSQMVERYKITYLHISGLRIFSLDLRTISISQC